MYEVLIHPIPEFRDSEKSPGFGIPGLQSLYVVPIKATFMRGMIMNLTYCSEIATKYKTFMKSSNIKCLHLQSVLLVHYCKINYRIQNNKKCAAVRTGRIEDRKVSFVDVENLDLCRSFAG
jgi:hypothetical protein